MTTVYSGPVGRSPTLTILNIIRCLCKYLFVFFLLGPWTKHHFSLTGLDDIVPRMLVVRSDVTANPSCALELFWDELLCFFLRNLLNKLHLCILLIQTLILFCFVFLTSLLEFAGNFTQWVTGNCLDCLTHRNHCFSKIPTNVFSSLSCFDKWLNAAKPANCQTNCLYWASHICSRSINQVHLARSAGCF